MATHSSLRDWSALLPALRDTLRGAQAPMTGSQVRAALPAKRKPTVAEVQAILDDEAARGELYRWEPASGKTPRYWNQSPEAFTRPLLMQSLGSADKPMTAVEYRKLAKLDAPTALVERLLEEIAAEGRCRRYEPLKKNAPRYWAGDPDRYARTVMLEVLAKGKKNAAGMTWAELLKALGSPLKGYSEDALSQLLQGLIDEGQAFKALKFSAGEDRYTTRPPDLVALVRESLAEIHKKFAKAGVSAEQVDQAARAVLGVAASPRVTGDLASEVLKTFTELKRERYGHSGLVPIPAVRRSIASTLGAHAARHDVLDDVIKGLVKDGKLNIIPLNDATGISADERNDALPGIQETWYYLESRS